MGIAREKRLATLGVVSVDPVAIAAERKSAVVVVGQDAPARYVQPVLPRLDIEQPLVDIV